MGPFLAQDSRRNPRLTTTTIATTTISSLVWICQRGSGLIDRSNQVLITCKHGPFTMSNLAALNSPSSGHYAWNAWLFWNVHALQVRWFQSSRVEAAAVLRADSVCHSRTVPEWKSAAEECGVSVEQRRASSVWRLQEQIYDTSAATSA